MSSSWWPKIPNWGAGQSRDPYASSSSADTDSDDDVENTPPAAPTTTQDSSSSTSTNPPTSATTESNPPPTDPVLQHLRKEQEIGIARKAFNAATAPVWWAGQKTASVVGGGAGYALTPVAEAVLKDLAQKAIKRSHPRLDFLVKELPLFQKQFSTYPPTKITQLIEHLRYFKERFFDVVLKDTMEPDGKTPARPNTTQYQQICVLLEALEKGQVESIALPLIQPVLDTFSHFQALQKGYLQQGAEYLQAHGVEHLKAFLGLNKTTTPVNTTKIKAAQEQERVIQQMAIREEVRDNDIPKEFSEKIKIIGTQFQQLSVLAEKIVLVKLIFPNDPDMLAPVLELAKVQHAGDPDIDLDTDAFYEGLTLKFNEKPRSFFERRLLRFHLTITASIISFYIKHISIELRSDLINFLLKRSDDRLDDVFSLLLDPFKDHLTNFYSKLKKIDTSSQELGKQVEKIVEGLFKQFKVDGKSQAHLMNELAALLVNKYAPTFSWTSRLKTILNNSLPQHNPVFDIIKKFLVGVTTLMTGPVQWILNVSSKRVIQWVVNRFVLPTVLQSTQTALGVGSHYQHAFNLFLEKKLTTFNAGMSENRSKQMRAVQSSLKRQREMKDVMEHVLIAIPLQTAMNTPESLQQYLTPGFTLDGASKLVDDAIRKAVSTDASLEVLKVLEQFLEPELLSEFVCYTFKDLIKNMAEKQHPVTPEIMQLTEQKMLTQLRTAVRSAVEEAVDTALHPSKKLNDATAVDIEHLRETAVKFVQSCKGVNESSFKQHDDAWIDLIGLVSKLKDKWKRTAVPSLVKLSENVGESFITATAEFSQLMKSLQPLQQTRNSLQETIKDLKAKQTYFNAPHLTIVQINAAAKSLFTIVAPHQDLLPLKAPLTAFLAYTQVYMELRNADKSSKDILDVRFQEIKQLLGEVILSLEAKRHKKSEEMNNNTQTLGKQLEGLKIWAESLATIEVTPEEVPSALQWFGEKAGEPAQDYLVKRLMEYVNATLAMKSKSYHWNGVVWRIVDAYLRAPPQKQLPLPETFLTSS